MEFTTWLVSTIMTPPRLPHASCMGSCSTTPKREFSLGWSLVLCPSFSPHLLHLSCHPSISLTSLSSHAWVQHTTVGLPSTFGGYGVTSWCVCHVEMGCVFVVPSAATLPHFTFSSSPFVLFVPIQAIKWKAIHRHGRTLYVRLL